MATARTRAVILAVALTSWAGCSLLFGWADLRGEESGDGGRGSDVPTDAGTDAGPDGDAGGAALNGYVCPPLYPPLDKCHGAERCCYSHVTRLFGCATEERCDTVGGDSFFPCMLASQCDGGLVCCFPGGCQADCATPGATQLCERNEDCTSPATCVFVASYLPGFAQRVCR